MLNLEKKDMEFVDDDPDEAVEVGNSRVQAYAR